MELLITQPLLQLFTLLITTLSSFFLIHGAIKISPTEMAKVRADTVIGFSLLMISLPVQAWSISQPLRIIDTDGLKINQIIIVSVAFLSVILLSEYIRRKLIRRYTYG